MTEENQMEIYLVEGKWYQLGWKEIDSRQIIQLAKQKFFADVMVRHPFYRS
jgi:hypothetical protein